MKGILNWILILAAVYTAGTNLPLAAQNTYNVVFYNVENLFDTRDDSLTADEEFTPFNERHWTRERFDDKCLRD